MKRSTKALTFLLVLTLIVGSLAIYASATANDMLSAATSDGNVVSTFNEDFTEVEYTSDVKNASYAITGALPTGFENGTGGRHGHVYSKTSGDNTYIRFWHQNSWVPTIKETSSYGTSTEPNATTGILEGSSAFVGMFNYNAVTSGRPSKDDDIAILEFDVSSDMYLDANGALTKDATDKLAYISGAYTQLFVYRGDSGRTSISLKPKFTYNSTEKTWYYGIDSAKAPLSTKAGEWNHITIVFDLNVVETATAGTYDCSSSALYIYVNGEFAAKNTTWSSSLTALTFNKNTDFGPALVRFQSGAWHAFEKNEDESLSLCRSIADFSMCIDNLTSSTYANTYSGKINGKLPYKGDTAFELGNAAHKLYELDDIVFNANYQYPTPNIPVATVKVGEDVVEKFYFANGVNTSKKIEDGCILKLEAGVSVADFDPALFGIENGMTVELGEGASLEIASGSPYIFDGTTISKATNSIPVTFYGDKALTNALESASVYAGQNIDIPTAVADAVPSFVSGETVSAGKIYSVLSGWNMKYVGASGEVDTPLAEITPALFNEIYANTDARISVYPVYTDYTFAFELFNDKGEIIDATGKTVAEGADLTVFADPDNIVDAFGNAPANTTVKLHSDILLDDAGQVLNIRSNIPIFFDLNGYTLTRNQTTAAQANVFKGADYSVFTLYSSRAGGTIYHTGFYGTTEYYFGSGSTINAYSSIGFDFTFGAYKNEALGIDADGDNLSIFGTAIVDACSWEDKVESKITINGGKYFRTSKYANALFRLVNKTTFNAKNAEFYSFDNSAIIHDEYTKNGTVHQPGVTATFDGCTLVKNTGGQGVFNSGWGENSTVTFKNSTIIGSLPSNVNGQLIFGENVILSNHATINGKCIPANGFYIQDGSGESRTFTIAYKSSSFDGTVTKFDDEVKTTNINYTVKHITRSVTEVVKESAKVNLTTDNGFFFNLYLPESFGAKVYLDPECTNEAIGVATEFGMRYTAAAISPAHIEAVTFYVKALDGNGKLTEAVSVYGMTLAEYYTAVLEGDYTDLEKKLVVNAANYCEEVYKFVNNGASSGAYDGILTAANLTLTSYNKDTLTEDARRVSLVPLTASIYGATVYIGEGNLPVFAFVMQDGVTDSVSVDTYSIKYGARKTHAATSVGKYALCSGDYGIYDLVTDMTVTVDGNVGTYNIAAYISSLADDAEGRELAEAMYAYSLVSREYVTSE